VAMFKLSIRGLRNCCILTVIVTPRSFRMTQRVD
jgi:hypothetical protein